MTEPLCTLTLVKQPVCVTLPTGNTNRTFRTISDGKQHRLDLQAKRMRMNVLLFKRQHDC
jgi:hypothetical protein